MFAYDRASFRYAPFPTGVAKGVFPSALHERLCATFPSPELFRRDPDLGNRCSFSRTSHAYRQFLGANPEWRALTEWAQSEAFVSRTLGMLRDHGIDLGENPGTAERLKNFARGLRRGTLRGGLARIRTELYFCAMPADGGFLLPHTDHPGKIANIVLSMNPPGEWDSSFGGSTDINWPNDPARTFNHRNARFAFEDVHVLDEIPYEPNQAVIVIKTFNSWHSIRPMNGRGSNVLRKTVNINLLLADVF